MRTAVSLVEILLATLVLALALIPIFSLIQSGTKQVRFNEDHAMASLLASQVLERYRPEPIEWLASEFASEKFDTIENDRILRPADVPEAQEFLRAIARFRRSLQCVTSGDTRVLVARVSWQPTGMQAQEVVRKLVIAPNPALGARP